MIRQFYLKNEYGERWSLNSAETGLLIDPEGLGYSLDASYMRVGSNFVRSYINEKQQPIKGTLVFGTNAPYLACNAFIGFCNRAKTIELIYHTDVGEYMRQVDLVTFGKTEIGRNGVLECEVSFSVKSLWYSNYANRYEVRRVDGELRWDYRWPARFNDYESRKITVNNDGHVSAPFKLEIDGYCENPLVVLVADQKELYRVQFQTILQPGEKILYSSVDGDLYCLKVDENGNEENFADNLDINNTNFFKIPVGVCLIRITDDTNATNRISLTSYNYYRAV